MRTKIKKQVSTLAKLAFAAGLVFWLIKTDRFKLEDLKPFLRPENFLAGFSLVGLNLFLASERWRLLMKSHDLISTVWATWKLTLTGAFFNFAVPGGVGGDVVKAYYLQKDLNASRAAAFSSALMDRLIGLYTCVLMAFTALIYGKLFTPLDSTLLDKLFLWVSLLLAGLSIGALVLAFAKWPNFMKNSQNLLGLIHRFAEACQFYFRHPRYMITAVFLTLAAQLISILFFAWSFNTVLQENVGWPLLFFVVPVGFMVMAVPITPAGVGVGQAVFYFLFQRISNNEVSTGSSVITAFQMIQFAWGLVGAYYYTTRKTKVPLTSTDLSS